MANPKPFVQIAAFCENLLEEADGAMTPVRIIDTYWVPPLPEGLPDGMRPIVLVKGIIALKSGDVTGPHAVSLEMENTQGVRTKLSPEEGWPVVFNGGEHGVNLKINFPLGVKNFGLCWFDVFFDGELVTRIPLRLREGAPPTEEKSKS